MNQLAQLPRANRQVLGSFASSEKPFGSSRGSCVFHSFAPQESVTLRLQSLEPLCNQLSVGYLQGTYCTRRTISPPRSHFPAPTSCFQRVPVLVEAVSPFRFGGGHRFVRCSYVQGRKFAESREFSAKTLRKSLRIIPKANRKILIGGRRKVAYVWNEGLQPILKHARYPMPSIKGTGSADMPKCSRSTIRISCMRFSTFGHARPVFIASRRMPPWAGFGISCPR